MFSWSRTSVLTDHTVLQQNGGQLLETLMF